MHLQKLSCSHKPIRFFAIPKNDKIDFRLHEFQHFCGHNQMIIEYPFAQLPNSDFCANSPLALKGCVILWSDRIAWVLFKAQLQNIQRSQLWRFFANWAIFGVKLATTFLQKSPAKFGRFSAI